MTSCRNDEALQFGKRRSCLVQIGGRARKDFDILAMSAGPRGTSTQPEHHGDKLGRSN